MNEKSTTNCSRYFTCAFVCSLFCFFVFLRRPNKKHTHTTQQLFYFLLGSFVFLFFIYSESGVTWTQAQNNVFQSSKCKKKNPSLVLSEDATLCHVPRIVNDNRRLCISIFMAFDGVSFYCNVGILLLLLLLFLLSICVLVPVPYWKKSKPAARPSLLSVVFTPVSTSSVCRQWTWTLLFVWATDIFLVTDRKKENNTHVSFNFI